MRVTLVGCGAISHNHLPAICEVPGAEIVALCDKNFAAAEACRDKYAPSAVVYTDYLKMLDEVCPDSVHITTPHYLHCEMTCEALARGINVFLEKPVATSEDQIRRMLEAEKKSTAKITVCFQNRFNSVTVAARDLTAEHGGIVAARGMVTWKRTEPYYTESGWRGSYATEGGGVMINQAIHCLDLLIGTCGIPTEVIGTTANHHLHDVIEVEDSCEMRIRFDTGATALFYASTAFPLDAPNMLEFFCRDGARVTITGDDLYLNGEPVKEAAAFKNENYLTPGKQCWGNGHKKLISLFYDALKDGKEMPVSLRSAADAVLVLLSAYRSDDRTVHIPKI